MISLDKFFRNPFEHRQISDDELRAFGEDHLGRLSAANHGGEFDSRLTDTNIAFQAFFGQVTSEELKVALQKSATQTMHARWSAFISYMTSRGAARVVDRAGKPSALYTQFFPRGLDEYHQGKIADAQSLAERVKQLAATNAATLGADFVTTLSQLVDDFNSTRAAQVISKGQTVDAGVDRRAMRQALQLQLFDNLLALAQKHKGHPDAVTTYFNQALLESPQSNSPPPSPPPGTAPMSPPPSSPTS